MPARTAIRLGVLGLGLSSAYASAMGGGAEGTSLTITFEGKN